MENVSNNIGKNRIVEKLNLLNTELGSEFFYPSLPLAMIDAVFSIRLDYDKAVKPLVEKYKNAYGERQTVSEFIKAIENLGVEEFADKVLTKHKTAGENKILKVQAVYEWAEILRSNGIETIADINKLSLLEKEALEKKLSKIQGQGETVIKYFFMLCGDEKLCKPDRHLLKFLSDLTGKKVNDTEAQEIMEELVKELKKDYKNITVRQLDYIIWSYQKSHSK